MMAALRGGYSIGMKHLIFAAFILAMLLYGSQNWHQYTAVIMTVAWVKHGGRLNARIF